MTRAASVDHPRRAATCSTGGSVGVRSAARSSCSTAGSRRATPLTGAPDGTAVRRAAGCGGCSATAARAHPAHPRRGAAARGQRGAGALSTTVAGGVGLASRRASGWMRMRARVGPRMIRLDLGARAGREDGEARGKRRYRRHLPASSAAPEAVSRMHNIFYVIHHCREMKKKRY
jgi:hypothetical protein